MPHSSETRATLEDLYDVEGKAELIGGRIVRFMGTGRRPARVAARIFRSLDDYAEANGRGEAYTDGMTFGVPELSSGRESFMPDVSYYFGPFPANEMRWIDGPPTFAVEVRSESDHGPAAEIEMAAKRLDYFEAGSLVVWDVDPVAESIHAYRPADPSHPTIFARGDVADAEPAAPGWRIAVDAIFRG
ncbi:Uma2 family endonuclease [Tundrisphaera lichenicola]|uniref:Uma2 family endonuclease n=1 Tax=Tundrisphaera lichenicola TaxID=2029860 RepID=UPI003EBA1FDC